MKNFSSIIYFYIWSQLSNTTDFNSVLADQFEAKKWHLGRLQKKPENLVNLVGGKPKSQFLYRQKW